MNLYSRDYWHDLEAHSGNCRCRMVPLKAVFDHGFEQSVIRFPIGAGEAVAVQTATCRTSVDISLNVTCRTTSAVRFFEVYPESHAGHESLEWLGTYNPDKGTVTTMGGKCHNVTSMGDAVETLSELLMLDTPLEDL
jgi:hypothetical protein